MEKSTATVKERSEYEEYESYLAAYHGIIAPLSFDKWYHQNHKINSLAPQKPEHVQDDERRVPRQVEAARKLPDAIPMGISNEKGINPKDIIGLTKLPLRFIPPSSLAFLARVMELGAIKYGPMNWRQDDVRATVYYEAALRHIWAALDGEELDPESGQPHAAHAMACMAILLDAKATENLIDDRFTPGAFGKLAQEMISNKEDKQ